MKAPVVCRELPIGRRMAMIVKLYHHAVKQQIACSVVGRNYAVLVYLSRRGEPLTQQELVDNLGIDKASMVRVLDELFGKGLIERKVHPSDRRSHQVVLTESGKAQLPGICSAVEAVNGSMMKGLSTEEQVLFAQSLERIQSNLQHIDEIKQKRIPAA